MTNYDLYRLLNLVINKDVYANAISPTEFDLQLRAKSIILFTSKIPSEKSINTQQVGVGVSRATQHDLSPFLIDSGFPVTQSVAVVPGLYYCENFYSDASLTSELISLGEVASRLKSFIKPPSENHLVGYIIPDGLKVLGMASGVINIIGYRLPTDPAFYLTTNPETLDSYYDPIRSRELEWSEGCKLDILYLILQDMGVIIERQEVSQLANKLLITGK